MRREHDAEVNALRHQVMTLSSVSYSGAPSQSCISLPATLGHPTPVQSSLLAQSMQGQPMPGQSSLFTQSTLMQQSIVPVSESGSSTAMMESRIRDLEQVLLFNFFKGGIDC